MAHPRVEDSDVLSSRRSIRVAHARVVNHSIARPANLPVPSRLEGTSEGPRRTPRRSVIVVLGENNVLSADALSDRLMADDDGDVDVIVACAGQPRSLAPLQRQIRDFQVLLAPAGTSTDDLRALAIQHAPGDIITLLSEFPVAWDASAAVHAPLDAS